MSVYTDILTADALLAAAAVPTATVVIRKEAVKLEFETLPLIVISPGKDTVFDEQSEAGVFIEYEVWHTIIYAGNQVYESGFAAPTARQALRKALHRTSLPGVSVVYDSDVEMNPLYDKSAFERNYEYSPLLVRWRTEEDRN